MKYNYSNNLLKKIFITFLLFFSIISLGYSDTNYLKNSNNFYDPLDNIGNDNLSDGVYINYISQEHLDEMQAMIDAYDELHSDEDIPDQLFDITFTIDDSEISNIQELTGLVTYTSFGKVPTPVNYSLTLKDKLTGEILRKYPGYIVVQTEMVEVVYFEEFNDLNLPYGDYVITYKSVYNYDVIDEFVQEFSIVNKTDTGINFNIILGVIMGIIIFGGSFFFFRK